MTIAACPRCASRTAQVAPIGDGAVRLSVQRLVACTTCGFQGPPVLLADEAQRESFQAALQRGLDLYTWYSETNPPVQGPSGTVRDDLGRIDATGQHHIDTPTRLAPPESEHGVPLLQVRTGERVAAIVVAAAGVGVFSVMVRLSWQFVQAQDRPLLPLLVMAVLLQLTLATALYAGTRYLWRGRPRRSNAADRRRPGGP